NAIDHALRGVDADDVPATAAHVEQVRPTAAAEVEEPALAMPGDRPLLDPRLLQQAQRVPAEAAAAAVVLLVGRIVRGVELNDRRGVRPRVRVAGAARVALDDREPEPIGAGVMVLPFDERRAVPADAQRTRGFF